MKTLRGIPSLDRQFTRQHRWLFRHLGLLILIIVALTAAAVVYFDKRQVEDLSHKLMTSTAATMVEQIVSFFETVDSNLRVAVEQLQLTQEPDDELMKKLFFRLSPFLNQYQNTSGIIISEVGSSNKYLGILKPKPMESEFLVRKHFPKAWGSDKARLERWKDGEMLESWIRKDDFFPKTRPWYQDALEAEENVIVTSLPYLFHTAKKPGITLSTRWRKRDTDRQFILAIDIMLSNISRLTQTMRPTENGLVFAFTQDLRFVGLPADKRFSDEIALNAALLKSISEVNIPVLQASVAEWKQRGRASQSFPFKFEGQNWWAGFEWNEDHPEHMRFWTGILVPESDFLGVLSLQRNFVLAAIIGLGLLLALILAVNAVRKIRQDFREAISNIGPKLGPFELLYKIGGGGNGTVYRAKHALLKRPTAVKVMLPQFASSESAKERFKNEVQITSILSHPNTVAVYDFGQTPDGTLYYAMEHLNGVTLEGLVRISGPQPATRVVSILKQVCGSLKEAHGQGLIHRDIKPSNIMLCEHGGLYDVVKVLDFGMVKDIQQDGTEMSQTNVLVGTPFYMAPELINDASAFSPSSDLYALGGVSYYLLTGHNVFEGTSAVEICAMHLHDQPVPPSQRTAREIPSDLEALVMACLAKHPGKRPQSAGEMFELLARCKDSDTWTQEHAQKWWLDNRSSLPMEEHEDTHSPLSDTHRLMD
jgi:tRNA A-37 threonylcarbamoyl transferase component Bud32